MSPLETLELDYKTKGYLDPEKLFKVLREMEKTMTVQAVQIQELRNKTVKYTNPESH